MSNYSSLKHLLHVITFCSIIIITQIAQYHQLRDTVEKKEYKSYNYVFTLVIQILQYTVLLPLLQVTSNVLGLNLFNAFKDQPKIKNDSNLPLISLKLPHLCFRVVTRGLYPEFVQRNVNKNFLTCIESGLTNFSIEVVTDKELYLTNTDSRIRQIVVPSSYETSTGAMFKARALQYALEPQVNVLNVGDYIVHLDEETIITKNVIVGIINFALDGTHDFGQGLITYINQEIVNWFTTMADFFRVAEDMGKLRFQFKAFHKPIYGWKGSFVVCKYEAEQDVSFDHGPDGSISEDCYFAMVAFMKGYSFDFIEGEMWEKSPFTIPDLIRQRKRWLQGIWLVVHSSKIPFANKFFLKLTLYAWVTLPLTIIGIVASTIFPVPTPMWISLAGTYCFAVSVYMYIFGVLKSFDVKSTGKAMVFVYAAAALVFVPLNVLMENIAIVWGLFGSKHQFYIVKKDVNRKVTLEV